MNKRSTKRLEAVRKLPCVSCGKAGPSEAAHANWAEYGKGMGTKAADTNTIALCRVCHKKMDEYHGMTRMQAKELFEKLLIKTSKMLNISEMETF